MDFQDKQNQEQSQFSSVQEQGGLNEGFINRSSGMGGGLSGDGGLSPVEQDQFLFQASLGLSQGQMQQDQLQSLIDSSAMQQEFAQFQNQLNQTDSSQQQNSDNDDARREAQVEEEDDGRKEAQVDGYEEQPDQDDSGDEAEVEGYDEGYSGDQGGQVDDPTDKPEDENQVEDESEDDTGGGQVQDTPDDTVKIDPAPEPDEIVIEDPTPEGEVTEPDTEPEMIETNDPIIEAEPEKEDPSPENDPDFEDVKGDAEDEAKKQKKKGNPQDESQKAQKAAKSPANEKRSKAANKQVEIMDIQEPKPFDAAKFKQMLMEKIATILPRNEEDAAKFADSGKMSQVGNFAKQQVNNEKQNAAGNIQNATKQPLDVSSIPDREVTPLQQPDMGKKPGDIKAERATPKPLGQDEVEQPLDQGYQDVERQMQQNDISDEQLANSNEPSFLDALSQKNEAKNQTEQTKQQFRMEEQQMLFKTKNDAKQNAQQQLGGMHNDRKYGMGALFQEQNTTADKNTAERQRVSDQVTAIYDKTKQDVEGMLNSLDTTVATMFQNAADAAGKRFEQVVKQKMDAYCAERYSGIGGALVYVWDSAVGMPDEVNQFFVDARKEYLAQMDNSLNAIANVVANFLNAAKQRINQGRRQVVSYVESLPQNLQQFGRDAARAIQNKFNDLDRNVDNKQGELINQLAKQYVEAVQKIDERIEELKAANRGLLGQLWDALAGVIAFINEVRTTLTNMLSRVAGVVGSILWDPIGFLGNLVQGVGQGLNQFVDNFGTHLLNGAVAWLTGEMGDVDVEIPENLFSVEGMFSFVGQILGLSWDYVRGKAVEQLGEKNVERMEKSYEIFTIIKKDGLAGLWQFFKDKFSEIKDMVWEEIQSMLIEEVVTAGIEWIIGLLSPAGAFIKAAKAIIKIVQFFIDNWDTIVEMVNAILDMLEAIANGDTGAMADAVENAMASTIPAIIGFLASLVGLDGIGKRIQGIIESIRGVVDTVVDAIIAKAKDWLNLSPKERKKQGKGKAKGEDKAAEGGGSEEDAHKDAPDVNDHFKPLEDNRSSEEQQSVFNTALKEAMSVVEDDKNTADDIVVKVDQILHRYQMEQMEALLFKQLPNKEVWLIKAKVGAFKGVQKVERSASTARIFKKPSDAHSINTIGPKTRFGDGNRNTPKTIAMGDIDFTEDVKAINEGRASFNEATQEYTAPSGIVYGIHPSPSDSIFPKRGSNRLISVTQAEFSVLKQIIASGGLKDDAEKMLNGLLSGNNQGVNGDTREKLLKLYESKK